MAITYTNDIKTVLDALELILNTEFKPIPIVIEPELDVAKLAKKNEYIRVWCTGDERLSRIAGGVYRIYNIDIVYYLNKSYYRQEKILDEDISPRIERIERLLENNITYGDGATWYNIAVNTINYNFDLTAELDIEGVENIVAVTINIDISRGSFF